MRNMIPMSWMEGVVSVFAYSFSASTILAKKLYDVALKDVWPADGAKSLQACQHHIVLAAGTVDMLGSRSICAPLTTLRNQP